MITLMITLVVSACNMPSPQSIKAKQAEIQKANPEATVKVRVDGRCLK